MNDLVIQPGERVLKEDRSTLWIKSWISKRRGRLCFTTQRLIFEVDKPIALSAAQLIANELSDRVPIDVPRDALEGVERGKHGKHDNVLVVRTESESFKFFLKTPFEEWDAVLRQAIHDDKVALDYVLERLKPKPKPPPYR